MGTSPVITDVRVKPSSEICPQCQGNDGDAPCAYPGQGLSGCLRDERLRNLRIEERVGTIIGVDLAHGDDRATTVIAVFDGDILTLFKEYDIGRPD